MKITDRKIHNFRQGDEAWHAHRRNHYNASVLAAAMGLDPDCPRNELVRMLATGDEKTFSDYTQRMILDKGHQYEAMARPIAEEYIGDDLFPICVSANVDGLPLSASVDGATMAEDTIFEHKQPNGPRITAVTGGNVPERDKPQLEQCLLLVGATKALFMVSDGTIEKEWHVWYESDPALRAKIVPTWKQLQGDVAAYQPQEYVAAPQATRSDAFPMPSVRVAGTMTVETSNLREVQAAMTRFIATIPKKPTTDQEFSDCKAAVDKLAEFEERCKLVRAQVIQGTAGVADIVAVLDEMVGQSKPVRTATTNLMDARRKAINGELIARGKAEFDKHIAQLNATLPLPLMPAIATDFPAQLHNLKKYEAKVNAIDTYLSTLKIEANANHQRILANLKTKDELAKDYPELFADLAHIINSPVDVFPAIVKQRIADHQAEQERRAKVKAEMEAKAAEAQKARDAAAKPPTIVPDTSFPAARNTAPIAQPANWGLPLKGDLSSVAIKHRTADEIVGALMMDFGVSERMVIGWLAETDWNARRQAAA